MALDAATLKALQDYYTANPGALQYKDPSGMRYAAQYSGSNNPDDPNGKGALAGYSAANGPWTQGQQAQSYDTQGNQTGQWTAENPYSDSLVEKLVKAGLITMAGATAMGVGGSGFTGFGGSGAGVTGLGDAGTMYGGSGAVGSGGGGGAYGLGGGTFDTGLGSLTDAGISGSPFTAGAGAAGAPLPMEAGGWAAATGSGGMVPMSAAAGAGGALGSTVGSAVAPSVGGTSSVVGPAGAGSGLLSSLGGNLGTLATGVGALLGAQGNKNTTSSSKTLPDYLQGPVVNDLIPKTQSLLAQQTDPAYQQQWLDMQKTGQGLLNQPIAGNGFAQFQARRRF